MAAITFPRVPNLPVWRNAETGVEIERKPEPGTAGPYLYFVTTQIGTCSVATTFGKAKRIGIEWIEAHGDMPAII